MSNSTTEVTDANIQTALTALNILAVIVDNSTNKETKVPPIAVLSDEFLISTKTQIEAIIAPLHTMETFEETRSPEVFSDIWDSIILLYERLGNFYPKLGTQLSKEMVSKATLH